MLAAARSVERHPAWRPGEFCVGGYSFYDAREHRGLMRNLIVRTASTGEVMAIVVFGRTTANGSTLLEAPLALRFGLASLMWVVNTKLNDTIGDLEIRLAGATIFSKRWRACVSRSGRTSYQTNTKLTNCTGFEFGADRTGNRLRLYTGTGTIANFVADGVRV